MNHDGLRITDVVIAVGHRVVAPGIGDAGDRGRMIDTPLIVSGVGAPERRPSGPVFVSNAWSSAR